MGEVSKTNKTSTTSKKSAIGIDLGTTRCCVATIDNAGKPQTILNDLGNSSKK